MDYSSYNSYESTGASGVGIVMGVVWLLIMLAVYGIMVVSIWKLFKMAGKPGWASVIPVYNNIVELEIAGRPVWWILLTMFVPFFGTWVAVVALIDFVRSYQRSGLWVLFMICVPVVAYPWLAFSKKTQYRGPIAADAPASSFLPVPIPITSGATAQNYQNDRQPGQPAAPGTTVSFTSQSVGGQYAPAPSTELGRQAQPPTTFNDQSTEPTTVNVSENQSPTTLADDDTQPPAPSQQ